MQYLLDIIGSSIVAGFISLIIVTVNHNLADVSTDIVTSEIGNQRSRSVMEIMENDLLKIGYKVPNNKITEAWWDKIKFLADIDNNGIIDSIYYYCGQTSELTESPNNIYDRLLYRKLNSSPEIAIARINNLSFTFSDSNGTAFSLSSLSSSSTRNSIKSIKVDLAIDVTDLNDNSFSIDDYFNTCGHSTICTEHYELKTNPTKWVQTIFPKNL